MHLDALTKQIDATVVTSTAHQYPTERFWVTGDPHAVGRTVGDEQLGVKATLDEAYGNGVTVPCWYDPLDPTDVMLTQDPSVLDLYSLEQAREKRGQDIFYAVPLIALTLSMWLFVVCRP